MKDLAIPSGSNRQILVNGKTYMVPKFTPSILGQINNWLKDLVPNPKDEARRRMEGLSDAVALAMWSDAVQEAKEWPPMLATADGNRLLMQYNGMPVLIHALLSKANRDVTREESEQIVDAIGLDGVNHILELAGMEIKEPPTPGDDDPKA